MDEGQTINFSGVNLCRKYITYLSHPLPHIKQWHTWHQRKPHDLQHFKIAGEQDIFCMFSVIKLMHCQIFPRYIYMFSPVGQNHWQSLEGLEIKTSLLFPGVLHANPRFLSNSVNLKWLNANFFSKYTRKRGKNNTAGIDRTQIVSKISLQNLLWVLPLIHILPAYTQPSMRRKSPERPHCHNLISLQLPAFLQGSCS